MSEKSVTAPSSTDTPRRTVLDRVISAAKCLKNSLWGYDFFISYHWKSGGTYAIALAQSLRDRHYDVFLDRAEFAHGDDWKEVGAQALAHTSRLVLIATREAVTASTPVEIEVRQFSKRKKHIIPIVFIEKTPDGKRSTLDNLPRDAHSVLKLISEATLHIEEEQGRQSGQPNQSVVEQLISTQSIMRRRNVRATIFGAAIAVIIGFAAFATISWGNAIAARNDAVSARDTARKERDIANNNLAAANFALGRIPFEKQERDADAAVLWWAKACSTAVDENLHASLRNLVGAWSPSERRFVHDGEVGGIAFSPDGETVLTVSGDKTARMWNVRTGAPRGEPLTHEGSVNAAAFSRDGQTVLTGSEDKTARLWDARTGVPRGEPLKHQGAVAAVAFSPDGQTVLTGSGDSKNRTGEARLWPVPAPAIDDRQHPEQLQLSVEVRTGKRLDGDEVKQLTFDEWNARRLELDKLGGPCDRPTWDEYNAWLKKQPRRAPASRN